MADRGLILSCAIASRAAYLGSGTLSGSGLSLLADVSTEAFRFMVLTDHQRLFVAFRGTNDLRDLVADGSVIPEAFAASNMVGEPMVHGGFLAVWRAMRGAVREGLIAYRNGMPVVMTGHSLGAALATLAAADLILPTPEVITFGSPRVGCGEFIGQYDALDIPTTRVVHHLDLVPTVPGLPYAHVCAPLRIDDAGNEVPQSHTWIADLLGTGSQAIADLDGGALGDHHIDRYLAAVQAYATHPTVIGVAS